MQASISARLLLLKPHVSTIRETCKRPRSLSRITVNSTTPTDQSSQGRGDPKTASLKPNKKLRVHPSKEREQARRANHDRKAKRWESSRSAAQTSGDWAEQYFDEKWVHTQGRLSDWNPPKEEQETRPSRERHPHKHGHSSRGHDNRHERSLSSSVSESVDLDGGTEQPSTSSSRQHTEAPQSHAHEVSNIAKGPESQYHQFYATCHPGLEQAVAQELSSPAIGAQQITPGQAGVTFW